MAVVIVRSTLIANTIASPPVQNPVTQENGRQRSSAAVVTVTNGDSIGSVYRLARVFSHWRMQSLRMFNGSITSAAASLGLYRTEADGGALVLATAYANSQAVATANSTGLELMFHNRSIDKLVQTVWQDAGLTADPRLPYDLCLTLTAAATATGVIAFDVCFVVD